MSMTGNTGMVNRSDSRAATDWRLGDGGPYRDAAPRSETAIAAIARYAGTAGCGPTEVGHLPARAIDAVLIRAQAFGPEMPPRDIRLSPGQAIRVDGIRVPVAHLVNGATIVATQTDGTDVCQRTLDTADSVLAETLACERVADHGRQPSAPDGAASIQARSRNRDDARAAPHPRLTEIRRTLHARAEALGWKRREDANLTIVADEIELAPFHQSGERYWFSVPAAAGLRVRSSQGVLAHFLPSVSDWRTLGVAVSDVRIDGDTIDLASAAFGVGFYPVEQRGASSWRWTNGDAVIARRFNRPATVEIEVLMIAPSWRTPVPPLRIVG